MDQTWVCNTCGISIEKAADGNVEWINVPTNSTEWVARDMRIVHHITASLNAPDGSCQFDEAKEFLKDQGTVGDRSLTDYIGPDGLMNLLEHAADPSFRDIDVMEMIKRIHIPGYDRAKGHFEVAVREEVIELNGPPGFYFQRQIQEVIDHYSL